MLRSLNMVRGSRLVVIGVSLCVMGLGDLAHATRPGTGRPPETKRRTFSPGIALYRSAMQRREMRQSAMDQSAFPEEPEFQQEPKYQQVDVNPFRRQRLAETGPSTSVLQAVSRSEYAPQWMHTFRNGAEPAPARSSENEDLPDPWNYEARRVAEKEMREMARKVEQFEVVGEIPQSVMKSVEYYPHPQREVVKASHVMPTQRKRRNINSNEVDSAKMLSRWLTSGGSVR